MSSKVIKRIGIFFVTIFGLMVVAWYGGSRIIKSEFDMWAFEQRQAGNQVEVGSFEISGFPTKLHITLKDFEYIKRAQGKPVLEHHLEQATAKVNLLNPFVVRCEISPQTLVIHDGEESHSIGQKQTTADIALKTTFGFKKIEVRVNDIEYIKNNRDKYTSRAYMYQIEERAGLYLVNASLRNIEFPKRLIDPQIVLLYLDATVSPPYSGDKIKWLSQAQLDVKNFSLKSHLINAQANGNLHLDKDRYPEGKLKLELKGIDKLLNILVKNDVIDQNTAAAITVGLSVTEAVTNLNPKNAIKNVLGGLIEGNIGKSVQSIVRPGKLPEVIKAPLKADKGTLYIKGVPVMGLSKL